MLITAAFLWIAGFILAPILLQANASIAPFLYFFFQPLCHQLPERSFHIFGQPLAVCARCSGIYFGFWLGLLLLPVLNRIRDSLIGKPRLLLLFSIPLGIDLITENTNLSRLITGMVASFPISIFVWIAFEQFNPKVHLRRAQ